MQTPSSTGNPVVILNPAANRGKMEMFRELVRNRAERENAEYVETQNQGEAKARAKKAAEEGRAIIIVGGDGSIHEVVNGILSTGKKVVLGIVAAGSGNDFAWNTLKLPHDPAAAIERAFSGQIVEVDAGKMNGKFFANSFSVGLDADIAVAANQMKKIPFMSGARLYYGTTIKQLLFGYHNCPWLKFTIDGNAPQGETEKHFVLLAITNGPTYGAGFRINPTADHTDGLFDVCSIDYTPLLRALKLLPIIKKGEHAGLPEVTFYRAKTVHIESQKPVNVQMDGETMNYQSYDAQIIPGGLWVRV